MTEELLQVYSALNDVEAMHVAELLDEAGIAAQVIGGTSWAGGVLLGPKENPAVWVRAADQPQAIRVVADYEVQHRQHLIQNDAAAVESQIRARVIRQQACTSCGTPRRAVCSYCGDESDHLWFESENDDPSSANQTGRFVCPVCEEYTEPAWSETCNECGAKFAT